MAKKKKAETELDEVLDDLHMRANTILSGDSSRLGEDWDAFSKRVHEENFEPKQNWFQKVWRDLSCSILGFHLESKVQLGLAVVSLSFAFFVGITTQVETNIAQRVAPSYFCSEYSQIAVEKTLEAMVESGYSYEEMVKTAHSQKDPCYKYHFEESLRKHLDAAKQQRDYVQGWFDYLDTHPKPVVAKKVDTQ